jgi:FkbM family methyltransferase
MRYSARVLQYLNEIRTCRRMTVGAFGFVRLLCRTIEFHLCNLFGKRSSESTCPPEKYRIRLGGQDRDLWLRPRTGDIFIFHEIFTNECYRIPGELLSEARVIVDLGANIGLTTLFFSQFFPEARYVCVEPNPLNADVLRRNVVWLANRVSVIECAIAGHCGEISFIDSDWSWGGHTEPGKTGTRTVPCSTLGSILKSHHLSSVDLLKVDIEGAEDMVFAGRPDWLATVCCIVMEFHGGYGFAQFEEELLPFGFTAMPEGSRAGNVMNIAVSGRHGDYGSAFSQTT